MITCLPTGECYVGGSACVSRRYQQHKYDLRRGQHKSRKMQAAWDRHGEEAFSFGYAVKCEADDILRYEQHYLDRLAPEFNTEKMAGSSSGTKRSEEQRERLRRRPQSTARLHEFAGEMLTAEQISERTGLTVVGVRARLRTGVPLERPIQKGCPEPVDIGDGRMLTPREIADEFALPLTTVYSRLSRGQTGARLVRPRDHRGRNSRG